MIADLPTTDIKAMAGFYEIEPVSFALPHTPDFVFGDVESNIWRDYFGSRALHEIGVYSCPGVTLEDAYVMRHGDSLLVATAANMHQDKIQTAANATKHFNKNRITRRVANPAALVCGPGLPVFGHWISDFLPKFHALHVAGHDIFRLKYVFPDYTPPIGLDFVRLLGIPPENIIMFDPSIERLQFDTLLVPTIYHNHTKAAAALSDASCFVTDLIARHSGSLVSDSYEDRILISRRGWKSRSLINRDAIEGLAIQAGFTIYYPERLPPLEQVRLFHNAREIITEYGSAIHSTIFSGSGIVTCALRGSVYQPMFIQSGIGFALDQMTGYVFGETNLSSKFQDFSLDPDDFSDCLRTVFDRVNTNVRKALHTGTEGASASAGTFVLPEDRQEIVEGLIARIGAFPEDPRLRGELLSELQATDPPPIATDHTRAVSAIRIDFAQGGNSDAYCKEGWCGQEPGHRWMLGPASSLKLEPLTGTGDFQLRCSAHSMIFPPQWPRQRLTISLNGCVLRRFDITPPADISCRIPRELLMLRGAAIIEFAHPDFVSPMALGRHGDERLMSFAMKTLSIEPIPSA